MTEAGIFTTLLMLANFAFSYKAFNNSLFFDSYKFEVDPILKDKDYMRLVSSGFLHIDWAHIIFNMLSLYFFSTALENELGGAFFLTIYFASLIGGNLFALYI
jgi:membrane associated rhomboid family serine protease